MIEYHLEIFFLSHCLPFAYLTSISLSLNSFNPLIAVEGRTISIAAGNQKELVSEFPGKHVDTILLLYVASLTNCRMDSKFILVHQSKYTKSDLLESDLQIVLKELIIHEFSNENCYPYMEQFALLNEK